MSNSFWEDVGVALRLSLVEQLREFETPLVTEALSALGCRSPERHYTGDDIRLLTTLTEPMVGAALTLLADTSSPEGEVDCEDLWRSYALIEAAPVPVVVVMQAVGQRPRHECILGDGMAKPFKASGSCGLVTNGGARDIERINQVGYSVFGTGFVPNHGPVTYRLSDKPVEVSGVTFRHGDLVHGNGDGVIIVPGRYHEHIVETCILCRDAETRVHTFLRRTDRSPGEKREYVGVVFGERDEKLSRVTGNGIVSAQRQL